MVVDLSRFSDEEIELINSALDTGNLSVIPTDVIGKVNRALAGEDEPGFFADRAARVGVGWNRLEDFTGRLGQDIGIVSDEQYADWAKANEADIQRNLLNTNPEVREKVEDATRYIEPGNNLKEDLGAIGRRFGEMPLSDTFTAATALGAESLPLSIPAIGAGAATYMTAGAAAPLLSALAAGLGSGATEYAASLTESMAEAGVDPNNPEDVVEYLQDKDAISDARERARLRGLGIGAFDALSFGVAGRLFSAMRGGTTLPSKMARTAAGGTGEMAAQMGFGGAGEYAAQRLTGEKDLGEVYAEALGEFGPGAAETIVKTGASARVRGRKEKEQEEIRKQTSEEGSSQQSAGMQSIRDLGRISTREGRTAARGDQPLPTVADPVATEQDYAEAVQAAQAKGPQAVRKALSKRYKGKKLNKVHQDVLRTMALRGVVSSKSGKLEDAARRGERILPDTDGIQVREQRELAESEDSVRAFTLRPIITEQKGKDDSSRWSYELDGQTPSQLFESRVEAEQAANEFAKESGVETKPRVFRAQPKVAAVEQTIDTAGNVVDEAVREEYEPASYDALNTIPTDSYASLEEARAAATPVAPQLEQATADTSAEAEARTAEWLEQIQPVADELNQSLKKWNLPEVGLDLVNAFTDPEGGIAEGRASYEPGNRLITLSTEINKLKGKEKTEFLRGVLGHEVIHQLRNLGLFTDKEWQTLTRAAGKRKSSKGGTFLDRVRIQRPDLANNEAKLQEEAVAEMFREKLTTPSAVAGKPASILDRIRRFFEAIGEWATGNNIARSEDIMGAIESGEVGARERQPVQEGSQRAVSEAQNAAQEEIKQFSSQLVSALDNADFSKTGYNFLKMPRPKGQLFDAWFGDSKATVGFEMDLYGGMMGMEIPRTPDEHTTPKIMWHWTRAREPFKEFNPMSHFGTLKAAHDRMEAFGLRPTLRETLDETISDPSEILLELAERHGAEIEDHPKFGKLTLAQRWWDELPAEQKESMVGEYVEHLIKGNHIIPVYLSIENPVFMGDYEGGHDVMGWASALYHGTKYNDQIISRDQMERIATWDDLTLELEAMGYDGIVYVNDLEDPGSFSWVPLYGEQIGSVFRNWNSPEEVFTADYSKIPPPASADQIDPPDYSLPAALQPTAEKLIGQEGVEPTYKQATKEKGRHWARYLFGQIEGETLKQAFKRNVINKADRFYDMDRELAKSRGLGEDITKLGLHSLGQVMEAAMQMPGRISHLIDYGTFYVADPKTGYILPKEDSKSYYEIMKRIGQKNKRFFHAYRIAVNELQMRRTPGKNASFSTATDQELQAIIDSAPAEFKEVLNDLKAFQKDVLQLAKDAGVLSQEKMNDLMRFNHVPYYRIMEADAMEAPGEILGPKMTASLNNQRSALSYLREGGDLVIGDMYENDIRNMESIVRASIRNMANQQAGRVMDELHNAGIPTFGQKITNPAQARQAKHKLGFYEGGQRVEYRVDDPAMWAAISAMAPSQSHALKEIGLRFSALVRDGITLNPAFMLANLWRGNISAFVISGNDFGRFDRTMKGALGSLKNDTATAIIKLNTGMGGYTYGQSVGSYTKKVEARQQWQEGGLDVFQQSLALLKVVHEKAHQVGESTEMAERHALYGKLVAKGMHPKQAAFEAMNVINFNRKGAGQGFIGSGIAMLIPLIPFLNARIQGLYRLVENQKGEKRMAGLPAGVLMRGSVILALSSLGYLLSAGDDRWDDISKEDKLHNHIFFIGDKVVRVPRSFEVGAIFGAAPMLLYEAIRSDESLGDSAFGVMEGVAKIGATTFAFNPIPQFAKPGAEIIFDKNTFSWTPIEGTMLSTLKSERRFDDRTSEIAKALSPAIGGALSPVQIDHLITGYLGSIAQNALSTTDAILAGMGWAPDRPAGVFGDPVTNIPATMAGLQRFIREDWETASQSTRDFYEMKIEATQIERAIKDAIQTGNIEWAKKELAENKAPVALRKMFDKVGRSISEINRQERNILLNPNMSADEKREKRQQLREMKRKLTQQAARMGKKYGM